ncbi:MAG: hypothetical protein ACN6O7_00535 [Sphingobacterium sp.]
MSTRNIHLTNPLAMSRAFKQLNHQHTNIAFLEHTDFEIRYNVINSPDQEYKEPEGFPYCCTVHERIVKDVQQHISIFPKCCAQHAKLEGQVWFDKLNYMGLPLHTAKAVHFTEYQILNKVNVDDWYEEITQFIEYCIYSFGQFPAGFGPPLGLEDYLVFSKWIIKNNSGKVQYPKDRMTTILNYLEGYSEPNTEVKQADLNILINQYEKWLKLFPFDIPYFSPLKNQFSGIYPILNGESSFNKFLGTQKSSLITYSKLIDVLVTITKKILSSYSAYQLFQEGKLTDLEQKQLDVAGSLRRLQLDQMREEISSDQKKYIKVIKRWLKDEQSYLSEIAPILARSQQYTAFLKE